MIDRLPPQSLEAEQSVLGSILIDRDAVVEVAEFLRPADFYREANGRIYAAMLELFEQREPVDIVTVAEVLERGDALDGVGGRTYLSSLSNQTPTAVHAVQYARIVERKAVLRNLIGAAGRIASIGYEDPAEIQEAIDRAEAELFSVSERRVSAGFAELKSLLHEAFDRLDYLHSHRGEISGVRSGFAELDAMTTGFQRSDLVVLAARPSVGKTSLALNIAEHAAVRDAKSVGIFSLEMSKEQLVLRLLSSVGDIDSQRLRTGFLEDLDFNRVANAMTQLSEARVFIDDTPNISTMELRTGSRKSPRSPGASRPWPVSCRCRSSPSASCLDSRRCANRRSRVSPISGSRGPSSRTLTSSSSCGGSGSAARRTRTATSRRSTSTSPSTGTARPVA